MDYSWQFLDKVRRILNDMYGRAIEDDFAIKNPTKGVRIPKDKGENYHVLTKDENQCQGCPHQQHMREISFQTVYTEEYDQQEVP